MNDTSYMQNLEMDVEIQRIISVYSEIDREAFTCELLKVVQTSSLVKMLDETNASGPCTLRKVYQVCQSLGKVDTSLAWVVGVSNSAWSMRSCFRSFTVSDADTEGNSIFSMVLGRPGSLKKDKVTGNYLLNGKWKYASGWSYASFFFCLAVVEDDTSKGVHVIAVPTRCLELSDEWKAIGLRGTQSVTISAKDIEIPKHNIENYSQILSGENRANGQYADAARKGHSSYSGLFTGVLMNCLLGAILGATEAGLEYVETAANKFPVSGSTYALLSDSGAIRAELGRLRSLLDLYQRAAEYNADIIDRAACAPNMVLTVQNRVDSRCRATQIMRGCVDIVQDLLWIYGSSGLEKGNPLERIWRDVNTGARHGGFSKLVPEEAVGLARLGRNPKVLTHMF